MIEEARSLTASLLRGEGREHEAAIVSAGSGDDFGEVRAALSALRLGANRLSLLERALRCYADPTFWDEETPQASLAFHDLGEIARSALAGKELFTQHRD